MAVQMDAANEYFSCIKSALYSALTGLDAFSISMWVRLDDLTKDHDFCTWGPHGADTNGWLFWRDELGNVYSQTDTMAMLTDNNIRSEADTDSLNDSLWHHICATVELGSATGFHLYLDGVDVTYGGQSLTGYTSLTGYSDVPVRWGEENTPPDNWFDGIMDDPRIYGRVLAQNEVKTIHACRGLDDISDGLIVRYTLQDKAPGLSMDGTADEVKDSGPDGHHAYGDSGVAYATYRESAVLNGLRRRSA